MKNKVLASMSLGKGIVAEGLEKFMVLELVDTEKPN